MNTKEQLMSELQTELLRIKELMDKLDNSLPGLEQLELKAVRYGEQIDFDRLTHPQVVEVIKAVGGKWSKTPDEGGSINYETVIDGVRLRMWRGEPPPNCKIVEELVEEPAQPARMVTRRKLVCQ